jgi:hypothetical protein
MIAPLAPHNCGFFRDSNKCGLDPFRNPLAAYFGGDKKTGPSPIRPQAFADIMHFLGYNLGIRSHEPETTGVELPECPLRQGKFLRRNLRRHGFFPYIHTY